MSTVSCIPSKAHRNVLTQSPSISRSVENASHGCGNGGDLVTPFSSLIFAPANEIDALVLRFRG